MLGLGKWIKIGAVAAALAGLVWTHTTAYHAGRSAENKDAGNAAEKWRAGYRRCAERGGVYDFETGACDD